MINALFSWLQLRQDNLTRAREAVLQARQMITAQQETIGELRELNAHLIYLNNELIEESHDPPLPLRPWPEERAMTDAPPQDGLVLANEDLRLIAHERAAEVIKLRADVERLRALLDEATTNPEGDYYLGLRCGVEDREIYDRYDAAEYGWDQAFEYVASIAADGSDSERSGEAPK